MGIMIERIRSISSVHQLGKGYSATNNGSDDVFNQPSGSNVCSPSLKKQHCDIGMRPSVIQTSSKNEDNLQVHYNVPVSNPFSNLLN